MASLVDNVYDHDEPSFDGGTNLEFNDFDNQESSHPRSSNIIDTGATLMPEPPPPFSRKAILCGFCLLTILFLVTLSISVGTIVWIVNSKKGDDLQQTALEAGIGTSYVRWGRTECPDTAELVYSGMAGGSHWHMNGSGSNFLCLPQTPEYLGFVGGKQYPRAYIDGVQFSIYDFPPLASQNQHDAPCVLCSVALRGRMAMIPAKTTCPSGWTREYYGYLMSSRYTYKRTEFICVDRYPQSLEQIPTDQGGAVWYPVEVRCLNPDPKMFTGGLPCDKYPTGHELSCVVCTK